MATRYNDQGADGDLKADCGGTVNATDTVVVDSGAVDYTVNANALASTALAHFYIRGWEGDDFYYDDPFQLNLGASGEAYVLPPQATRVGLLVVDSVTVALLDVRPGHGAAKVKIAGTSTGIVTKLTARAGHTDVLAGVDVNTLIASGRGTTAILAASSHAATLAEAAGGAVVRVRRDAAALRVSGAGSKLIVDPASASGVTPSGNVTAESGGVIEYGGGDIGGSVVLDNATIDFSKADRDVTITGGYTLKGSWKVIKPRAGVTITMPTSAEMKGTSGVEVPHEGPGPS
jgi:hypothetical protein